MPNFGNIVSLAYMRILGRPPDPGGLAHFNQLMNDGLTEAMMRGIRKAVSELGEFESTLFQVGNEGFKRFSTAWEVGVYDIVKDELGRLGLSDRLVATNTGDPELEGRLDYIARHSNEAQAAGAKPIIVTEYPPLPSDEVIRQVRRARGFGTSFMYWRGNHGRPEWLRTLGVLRDIVDGTGPSSPLSSVRAESRADVQPATS